MDLFGDTILGNIIIIILGLVTTIILYFKYTYTYWNKRNVFSIPTTIPFGNFGPAIMQRRSMGEQVTFLYNQVKNIGKRYVGVYVFNRPALLLVDPEMCKNVMTKDFRHFDSRPTFGDEKNDPLTGHLLNMNGEKWKNMRSKLTPTFTSGKMKMMFQTLVACSEELEIVLEKYANEGEALEVKDTMGRFTTDIIGSCAFGIECNSLKEPDNIFRIQGKKAFEPSTMISIKRQLFQSFPRLAKLLRVKLISRDIEDFFLNLVKTTVDYREKNNIFRNDFMQLLMQLMLQGVIEGEEVTSASDTQKLTLEEITAQAFVFFLAGFETSSTTLSSFMYEVSRHQDVQDKVREEIHEVLKKHDGKLTYEAILEMTYMQQVVDETMRLHAVAPFLSRRCTADYQVPDSDLIIEKGYAVLIPVTAFHLDPQYYPNPEVFDPDRFHPAEKNKRHQYVFLPFGAGPRNCIGLRFGMMQMKVGLVALLKNYKFTLNPRTPTPLVQNPKSFLYSILGGIWVNAEKIN